jgi:hypothetical protein
MYFDNQPDLEVAESLGPLIKIKRVALPRRQFGRSVSHRICDRIWLREAADGIGSLEAACRSIPRLLSEEKDILHLRKEQ